MKFKGKHQRPNQIQRFSIRKFSVGIASVVIGSFFMGTIAPISVQAQESTSSQYVASAPTLSSITTSYQYVALQELTPAQQQAILSGTPSDIAQADQVQASTASDGRGGASFWSHGRSFNLNSCSGAYSRS